MEWHLSSGSVIYQIVVANWGQSVSYITFQLFRKTIKTEWYLHAIQATIRHQYNNIFKNKSYYPGMGFVREIQPITKKSIT